MQKHMKLFQFSTGPAQRTLCSHESCTAIGRKKISSGAWYCRKHMKVLQLSTSPCHQVQRCSTACTTNTELGEDSEATFGVSSCCTDDVTLSHCCARGKASHLSDVPQLPYPLRSIFVDRGAAACAFRQPLRNRQSRIAVIE